MAITELSAILGAQAGLLKKLNGKKPPSKAVVQSVLNSELLFGNAVALLVSTVTNPSDVTLQTDVRVFLNLDMEIIEKAEAILKKDTTAAERAAASPHAKARLRKELGKIEAEVKNALAQDQALTVELA
jgi:hypothetical protein